MVEMSALKTMFKTTISFRHAYENSTLLLKKMHYAISSLLEEVVVAEKQMLEVVALEG
jgi:hypothetical protein